MITDLDRITSLLFAAENSLAAARRSMDELRMREAGPANIPELDRSIAERHEFQQIGSPAWFFEDERGGRHTYQTILLGGLAAEDSTGESRPTEIEAVREFWRVFCQLVPAGERLVWRIRPEIKQDEQGIRIRARVWWPGADEIRDLPGVVPSR